MQAPHRLHWIPVEPSWLVSGALVLLAVLPHQVPVYIRSFLGSNGGAVLYVAAAAWLFTQKPVLAIAMALLFVGVWTYGFRVTEPFTTSVSLVKDRVDDQERRRRWFQEEVLSENPHGIQERTDGPDLLYDKVSDQERRPWLSEEIFNKHPQAIQERTLNFVL